ncbi:MAG TPA: hypothetical protein VEX68_29745 [Bryobacteraceae bacterium]|nr:hypothetical protein [Bryobacteraceae bacterium]
MSISTKHFAADAPVPTAAYGFNNVVSGSVTLRMDDRIPVCLYFFDKPARCASPDQRHVLRAGT